jgi:DNA-binding transcriptional LysR family regulator
MRVTVPASSLHVALRAVSYAAAKKSKPRLACVRLAVVDGALDVVATNGDWLARWREPAITCDGDGASAMSITLASAKVLIAMCAARDALVLDFDACLASGVQLYTLDPSEYPAYLAVIPAGKRELTDTTNAICAFDAQYLADIARACLPLVGKRESQRGLRLVFSGGAFDPVVIAPMREPRLTIVLMPVLL